MTRRTAGLVAALATAALLAGAVPATEARFRDADALDGAFSTATLEPATGLAGTGGSKATLTWTPSGSGWAAGYHVLRSPTSGGGYSQVGSVTPITATGTTDNPAAGTWYYVVRSFFQNWASVRSNEAAVVIGAASVTTPAAPCTGNAPVTTGAGDNDGYETRPAQGCVPDGAFAVDARTGTDTADSCTSTAKDRHDFWGFELGLPPAVTSIDGITVRPTAGMSNNGGTSRICVALSWDGGASWTAPQDVILADQVLNAYALGGAADTWGRAWTPAQLASGMLRVRITDTTTHPNKSIHLDGLQVEVTYTP